MPAQDDRATSHDEKAAIQPPSFGQVAKEPAPDAASKLRRGLIWVGVALVVIAAAVGGLVLTKNSSNEPVAHPPHNGPTSGPERPIFRVTSEFADALDEQDIGKLAALMCEDDRLAYLDHFPQEDVESGGVTEPSYQDLTVSDIEIRGAVARATVKRTGNTSDSTFYYRNESGNWLVCTSAENDFDTSDPSTTSSEGAAPTG